jgi:simple sugar transport system ATP-binding protein
MSEDLIRMEHINKFYGRVQALDDVNFGVSRHEIVGLLGDNGAGKSTLIKVLSGAVRATSGDIIVRGKRVDIRNTTDAIALGIETIYQDSALVTQLSIARNLFLGREPLKGPRFLNRMDTNLMEEVAGDLLRKVGIGKSIPASTPISSLSGGERQAVAIARAMHFDSDLIILDEPTNNLGVAETQGVLRFVRPLVHLHRAQYPPRVPGGRPHRGHETWQDRRRRHRSKANHCRRRRGRNYRRIGRAGPLIDRV